MSKQEADAYILGTEQAELHRLGLQHQVWAGEARRGWELGGFKSGQTILDLGCGPGFCSLELAYITGGSGQLIGVDKSPSFIHFLQNQAELHSLNMALTACSFDEMELEPNSLDGMYCRWALAWIPNPEEILAKVKKAMKPGGRMVIQEYFDWSTFQTEPALPHLKKGIAACLRSFKESDGEIDVGRQLPAMARRLGLDVLSTRPMAKLARPADLTWEWPRSFLSIYLPKLVAPGLLSDTEVAAALHDLETLNSLPNGLIFCPMMVEVVLKVG